MIFIFTFSVIHVCIFVTIFISDGSDCQEERRLQYLDQEKITYIKNYLAQSNDTDVHSVSAEDDSGKPGSSSAPSEVSFEETSGMTQPISIMPKTAPHPIHQVVHPHGEKLSSMVCPGMLHWDRFKVKPSKRRHNRKNRAQVKRVSKILRDGGAYVQGYFPPQENSCNREAWKSFFRHTFLNFSSSKTHLQKGGTFITPNVK